ncbi:transglycosylase SLT domain-containing protein [Paraburkholderia sp. 40]|uniref:lytic transglycosylase domain-containing protein n=1 Tax=Paraburkholderia sp. 40 TaxID=2991059 RepID=UPI003D199406
MTTVIACIAVALSPGNSAHAADASPASGPLAAVSGTAGSDPTPSWADIASMLRSRFHVTRNDSDQIAQAVLSAASRYAIAPVLLLAIIATESGFDRHAISAAGAKGLMQVLPTAHPQVVALNKDLSDPAENVRVGSSILRGYLDATQGDLNLALMRYSGGSKGYARRVALSMRQFAIGLRRG